MRTILTALYFAMLGPCLHAADFTRWSIFDSVDAFVAAAKAFKPANAKTDMSALFTVRDLGQREDPKTGTPVSASAIRSSAALWSDDSNAMVFVTAAPRTEATQSVVGVLFLLTQFHERWHIFDYIQFIATGKYADVSARLTADTGTGYRLGTEGMKPVVTITESQGGRGYSYQLSASYSFHANKLKRIELE